MHSQKCTSWQWVHCHNEARRGKAAAKLQCKASREFTQTHAYMSVALIWWILSFNLSAIILCFISPGCEGLFLSSRCTVRQWAHRGYSMHVSIYFMMHSASPGLLLLSFFLLTDADCESFHTLTNRCILRKQQRSLERWEMMRKQIKVHINH